MYVNMLMAFVRIKPTKKVAPANNNNQQTKVAAKKIRKSTLQKSLLNKLIWAGVVDEGGAGRGHGQGLPLRILTGLVELLGIWVPWPRRWD